MELQLVSIVLFRRYMGNDRRSLEMSELTTLMIYIKLLNHWFFYPNGM